MGVIGLTKFRAIFFLSLLLGLVVFCKPNNAHAVTTLTMGDGTVYFDDSNNYYTALCNALDVAVERGLCPSNFNYRYLLQQYPFLEYIDGDNPEVLLDIWRSSRGNIVVSVSQRTPFDGFEYFVNNGRIYWQGAAHYIFYDNIYGYFTTIPSSNYRNQTPNSRRYITIGSSAYLNQSTLSAFNSARTLDSSNPERSLDFYFDFLLTDENCLSFNLVTNSTNTDFKYISFSSVYDDNNSEYRYFTPIVLSSRYFLANDGVYSSTIDMATYLYYPESYDITPLVVWNDIAYSVIGESLTPDVVIPLLTPSPVPTMPYNVATPTPMLVDSGVFGFGDTDVNASSDYQNVLTAWIDGVNKLDNIIFLRVLADTILTSNMFSWILIPVAFTLIAWVWGLRPFSHKDGDDDD